MNRGLKITVFIIGGIIIVLAAMIVVANLVIGKIASNKLTHILTEQMEEKNMKAPVSFSDMSINPMMGEIVFSDLTLQDKESKEQTFQCEEIKLEVSHKDVVSLIKDKDQGELKDLDITIENTHFIHSASRVEITCKEIRLKFDGHITQKAFGLLGQGDFTPLLTSRQSIGVSASDIKITLPETKKDKAFSENMREKGLSIHTAVLDVTSIPEKRQIHVKSERISSPLWSGNLDIRIEVNLGDIEASEVVGGKIILREIHEDLRPVFERLEKRRGRKILRGDNSVVAEITGTVGKPQLIFNY